MAEKSDAFCQSVEKLATDPNYDSRDINNFYDAACEFARLPAEQKQLLPDDQAETIEQHLPEALQRVAKDTQYSYTDDPDQLRDLLSKTDVVTKDIYDVYKTTTYGVYTTHGITWPGVDESIAAIESARYRIQQELEEMGEDY